VFSADGGLKGVVIGFYLRGFGHVFSVALTVDRGAVSSCMRSNRRNGGRSKQRALLTGSDCYDFIRISSIWMVFRL
jgi:hypothetical protein